MKVEQLTFSNIPTPVTFYIGRTQEENHTVIDLGGPDDIWFHLMNMSSCHVVAILPTDCSAKQRRTIVRRGAALCKQHTAKVASLPNIMVTYTAVRNVRKESTPGSVTMLAQSSICV